MSSTDRQNNLILNEDWTRIYQTFKNADFKSYDFENLRRVIIAYLRENYPEDFNDYIESSEYLALIDAIAFLGQSLSFRVDLASRENFIELAERKESVLRIAKMLGYSAKRNLPATGLLKFSTVTTTEQIFDSNGRNLSQQLISWNDPTNTNWAEQFILLINAAMANNTEFGRPEGSANILGIPAEQYRFRTNSTDVPLYSFSKTVAGRNTAFEIVSTVFKNEEEFYEETPAPGNRLGFVYRQDGQGPGSINTGFFLQFKQGSLEFADFNIEVPTTNERVTVDSQNINNNDVWLFKLNSAGQQLNEWSKVTNFVGNNIAYNSIVGNERNIYAVETKENDRIDLVFADGVYGNLPQGPFRVYYRVSNGQNYSITPQEMRNISISVDYVNTNGEEHTLTIGLSLQNTISNASATETIDNIRKNAPANYYVQNRMITGEDYNLAPFTSSQDILKVKAVNRTSSGISRNFDIIDASGKYSSVNVFADDGYIYKSEDERNITFKFTNRTDIINVIKRQLEPIFKEVDVYNFYLTNYEKVIFPTSNKIWTQISADSSSSSGYFTDAVDLTFQKVGIYSTSTLQYLRNNANIRFIAPDGQAFKKGKLVEIDSSDPDQTDYIWTKVINVVGDGTNAGRGALSSGLGPIQFSDPVPSGAIANRIVPRFVTDLPISLENQIVNNVFQNLNFGLRYDYLQAEWKIIQASNLDLTGAFTLGRAGDVSNTNLDTSWIFAFVKESNEYVVRIRKLDYVFGSVEQNRFYFDKNEKKFNSLTGSVVKDQINVLSINTDKTLIDQLRFDYAFEVSDTIKFDDGYESKESIKIAFSDSDDDGVIDDPDSFENIVGEDRDLNFLFFQETTDSYGSVIFQKIDNSDNLIKILQTETQFTFADEENYPDGQLVYFYDANEDNVKRVDRTTNTLVLESSYRANIGRDKLKFQYIHNASEDRRIDPSSSNIIDLFLLTRAYDTAYRNYLRSGGTEPTAPSTDDLRITYGKNLNEIKSISDEIIYHPVKYKVLFGSEADESLRAKFKVVKNTTRVINDDDLKVRIVNAIDEFFDINNWDFGDRFYLSELITYITNSVSPDISNITILPRQANQRFGNLFEIQSNADEIFVSGTSVDDIEIVSSISTKELQIGNNSTGN